MSRFVVFVRVLPVALALTGLAAADVGLPSSTFWKNKHVWLYGCLAVAFLVSAASQSLDSLSVRSDAERVRRFETQAGAAMAAALRTASTALGVDVDRIGVHVFLVVGVPVGGRWWAARLVLVGRLRIGAYPTMHRPRWAMGKGVIGRAWLRNSYVAEEWQAVYEQGQSMGQEKWENLRPDDRYRMSWTELFETHGYQLIAARPVHDLSSSPAQVVGCVSIDAQAPMPDDHTALQSVLADLAGVIEGLEPPPRTWLQLRKHGY